MVLKIFQANTKAKSAEVNNNFAFLAGNRLIGFNPTNGQAKEDFDIGDLTEIVNGSLAKNILLREGGFLKLYNASGVFLRNISLDQATTAVIGQAMLPKSITIANNATDLLNDIDFSAGNFQFQDGSGQAAVNAMTKRLDASWAVASGSGGLFSGSKANNTWYHCFSIYNPTTGISDSGFDTSITAANKPSGYTKYKRVGSILTDSSGNIVRFFQNGNKFELKTPLRDIDTTIGTTASLLSLRIPIGVKTIAIFNTFSTGAGGETIYISNPETDDANPSVVVSCNLVNPGGGLVGPLQVTSNTSSQLRMRSSGGGTVFRITTLGWIDYQL